MISEWSPENEQIVRELLRKLQKYITDQWKIRNIVKTLDDIPEFLEMIEFLDNNQELSVREIDMKAVDIAYNSYKGELY